MSEEEILAPLQGDPQRLGEQGFVIGRGNLPHQADRRGGNIVVVVTLAKLARTLVLHFDTGDPIDLIARKFISVIVDYRVTGLVQVAG